MTTAEGALPVDAGPAPTAPAVVRFAYRARGDELFLIWIRNLFLTIVTLGLYFPWARAEFLRYVIGHIEIDGDPLTFHGEGGKMFRGLVKAILIVGGIVVMYVAVAMGFPDSFLPMLALYGIVLAIAGYALIGSYRYRLRNTSWRGIRFTFHGETGAFVKEFFLHSLLLGVTFGFGTPLFMNWQRRTLTCASALGTRRFDFDGEGRQMLGFYILSVLFTLPTLGLIWIWYDAKWKMHLWNHTSFGEARFRLDLRIPDYFVLNVQNGLLVIVTLGLAWPWVLVRTGSFLARHLELAGPLDLAAIRQEAQDAAATGEELSELFDMDLGIT